MITLEQLKNQIYEDRRSLHEIPEVGFSEYKTSEYIKSVLDELQVQYEEVGETGILAYVKGNNPKRTIAFRTDIDGLPVTEQSAYHSRSKHPNHMHACGHDGHMAMALGLTRYLKANQERLNDNIVVIFQPAEEGPGGAEVFIQKGLLKKYQVDEIYGIHIFPAVEQGKIGLCSGPMMAMTGEFDINITSKSAHGAMPHTGIDGLTVGAEVLLGLQTIVSRNVNPVKPAVLTVGRMEGGERRNIIAGKVVLEGTIRAFDESVYDLVKTRMEQYLKGIEVAYDVKIELKFFDKYPAVVNDNNLFEAFYTYHQARCEIIDPQMISEDFAYYQQEVPGLFYFIGSFNEEKGMVFPLHSCNFIFDDSILLDGIETYLNILTYRESING